jgi:folate-binding protein YgfZ
LISLAKKYFIRSVSVIEGRGSEVIDFLNRISTNELRTLKPGQTTGTIFLNEKGRILGFVKIINDFDKITMTVEKGQEHGLLAHLEKYIFSDDVKFSIPEDEYSEIIVFFNEMDEYVEFRNAIIKDYKEIRNLHYYTDSYYGNTFNIFIKTSDTEEIQKFLKEYKHTEGEIPDYYRIINKIPIYPNEINDTVNPLECGLEKYVSPDKGCYTGQEVIARIESRNKLPKSLRVFKSLADPGEKSPINFEINGKETEAGATSSVTEYENEFFCLGFIRTIHFSDENEYYVIKNKEKIKLILIN